MLFKQSIIKSQRYIILLARCNIFVKKSDSGFLYNRQPAAGLYLIITFLLLLLHYLPYILTTITHFYLQSLS